MIGRIEGETTEGAAGRGMPRRRFLVAAGSAVALAGLTACKPPAAVAPLIPPPPREPSPPPRALAAGAFTLSGWAALVGSVAVLDGPAGVARAEVVEVAASPGSTAADEQHRFSILLRATDAVTAPSAVHRVTVADAAPVDLFVSPVDRGARDRWYQIIVNNPS